MARARSVLVVPGFNATDRSTSVIRASLSAQGFSVYGWRLGRNPGLNEETLDALQRRLNYVSEQDGSPIGLVGWSLGGAFSHLLARAEPDRIHSVITLGSPLRQSSAPSVLPVPTTSIYSRNDNVVPWQTSLLDASADRHENIEVRSGHAGLGFDPTVLYVIADRLRQRPDEWRRFRPPLWLRYAFPGRTGGGRPPATSRR